MIQMGCLGNWTSKYSGVILVQAKMPRGLFSISPLWPWQDVSWVRWLAHGHELPRRYQTEFQEGLEEEKKHASRISGDVFLCLLSHFLFWCLQGGVTCIGTGANIQVCRK